MENEEISQAMSRFETILNFALPNLERGDPIENVKAEILKAADQLLVDSSLEMVDTTLNAICLTLLQIYKNGKAPGPSNNQLLNKLQEILVAAHNDDHSTEDIY